MEEKNLRDDLREKHPVMAKRAQRSRKNAIRLFCLECQGGSPTAVSDCEVHDCFLHPFRLGAVQEGGRQMTDEQREAAVLRLAEARSSRASVSTRTPEPESSS